MKKSPVGVHALACLCLPARMCTAFSSKKIKIKNQGAYPPVVDSPKRAGFTLLEVLLTSLLASVVLASLWSLSDVYLKLFAVGKLKIEETQLVRGLTERIAKDLTQVIQISDGGTVPNLRGEQIQIGVVAETPNGTVTTTTTVRSPLQIGSVARSSAGTVTTLASPPSEASGRLSDSSPFGESSTNRTSPKFGLFGTSDSLRLILLQTDPRTIREFADLAEAIPQPGQMRPAVATELRTIEYTFSRSTGYQADARQRPPGLLRREWPWESWIGLKYASIKPTDDATYADMMPDPNAEWTEEDTLAFESGRNILHVPQVIGIEFNYYDGASWDVEWNSWERGGLPQLVEVILRIKIKKDESASNADDEADASDESVSVADGTTSSVGGIVYRRLIQMPFANVDSSAEDQGRLPGADEVAGASLRTRPR